MSKYYTKRDRRIDIEFHPSSRATAHGGQMAINAVAGEFGLWQRVREEPALDPRTHKGKGYDPVVYVTALTSGGDSLADAERLEDDESLKLLLRVKKVARSERHRRRVAQRRRGGTATRDHLRLLWLGHAQGRKQKG